MSNVLAKDWQTRTAWLIAASLMAAMLFWAVGFTEWADGFRMSAPAAAAALQEEALSMPAAVRFVVPFVKTLLLIGLPMLLGLGVGALYQRARVRKKSA